MEAIYHLTTKRNAPTIDAFGLIPSCGVNRMRCDKDPVIHEKFGGSRISFCSFPDIIKWMFALQIDPEDLVIYAVDFDALPKGVRNNTMYRRWDEGIEICVCGSRSYVSKKYLHKFYFDDFVYLIEKCNEISSR